MTDGIAYHDIQKWVACQQEAQHLPCGCTADIILLGDVKPLWEQDMTAYLTMLRERLPDSKWKTIARQQKQWERYRKSEERRILRRYAGEGSYFGLLVTTELLALVEERALKLGCELEQLDKAPRNGR